MGSVPFWVQFHAYHFMLPKKRIYNSAKHITKSKSVSQIWYDEFNQLTLKFRNMYIFCFILKD